MFDITDNQLADLIGKWVPMAIILLVIGFLMYYSIRGTDFNLNMGDIFNAIAGL